MRYQYPKVYYVLSRHTFLQLHFVIVFYIFCGVYVWKCEQYIVIYILIYTYSIYITTHTHTHTKHMWICKDTKARGGCGCFPPLGQSLSRNYKLPILTTQAGQQPPRIHLSLLANAGVTGKCSCMPRYLLVPRDSHSGSVAFRVGFFFSKSSGLSP